MRESCGRPAMDAPFFHELRRQASSYLTGKIRSARLALTDVTPTQLYANPLRSIIPLRSVFICMAALLTNWCGPMLVVYAG